MTSDTSLPPAWVKHPLEEWTKQLDVPLLEVHAELPSTSDRVRQLALEGAPPFTTVVAGAQSRGRGRRGRTWHSPAGSGLWISVLLPSSTAEPPGPMPLAVGVATARAAESASGASLALKWPNDVLCSGGDVSRSGRKVAGVLCETVGDREKGIVAGIGINIRRGGVPVPTDLESAVAFLEEVSSREIAEPDLARALIGELRIWAGSGSPRVEGRLRSEWEIRDCLRGRWVHVDEGDMGLCRGVMADGALELARPDGTRLAVRTGTVRLADAGVSPALHQV